MDTQTNEYNSQLETESNGPVTVTSLYELLERQRYQCALTGRPLTLDNVSLDHIRPFAGDGEHTIGNVQLVTKEVNRAKGTLEMEEFIGLCNDVYQHRTLSI